MKILITGSNGLLGQKLVRQLLKKKCHFLATSSGENRNTNCPNSHYETLDISCEKDVRKILRNFAPDYIIHTAAITNVDYCESNQEECHEINVVATRYLFEESQKLNAYFLLLSTDFVFDGKEGDYCETDEPKPLSIYGTSKYDAERILTESQDSNWSIVRTIIVYGEGINLSRSNIVLWAREALRKGSPLQIIDDQFRSPTWADDLAWACIRICKLNLEGIYHISGPERMPIYDLVKRVGDFYQLETSCVKRTDSLSLNQSAKRPPITGFDISKAQKDLGYHPKTLEESLHLLS